MYKFTHIEAFKSALHYAKKRSNPLNSANTFDPRIHFRGTVKLHGTNAGVMFTPEAVVAQSRKRVITVEDDNYGFARFVHENEASFRALERRLRDVSGTPDDIPLVTYGEWIGPGIQKDVAVSALPKRQWVLFAMAEIHGDEKVYRDIGVYAHAEPIAPDIRCVMELKPEYIAMNVQDELSVQEALEHIDMFTSQYEDKCPWGAHMGVEGIGEGLVWTPVNGHWGDSELFFKSKGNKHKGKPKAQPVRTKITPETLESEAAFVEMAVTQSRLNQGVEHLKEMGHPFDMTSMREFLSWVGGDVKRECAMELEANNLDWKRVSKKVTQKSVAFFKEFVNRV